MISVLLRFRYGDDFDENRLRQLTDGSRDRFSGMPGLRSKAYTIDPEAREAINFYVWEDEARAREVLSAENLERVAGLYGVPPEVRFLEVLALVDNHD